MLSFRVLSTALRAIESQLLVISAGRPVSDNPRLPGARDTDQSAPLNEDSVAALLSSLANLPPSQKWSARLPHALWEATEGSRSSSSKLYSCSSNRRCWCAPDEVACHRRGRAVPRHSCGEVRCDAASPVSTQQQGWCCFFWLQVAFRWTNVSW